MPHVVSVRFRFNPKPLWFDPQEVVYQSGAEVLVETERGREVGLILDPAIEANDKQISKLKTPLKPVIRELTDLDYEHLAALEEKGKQAMPVFREKVKEYKLDIKPVEVQYLFSGERAVFFFSSEERIDFRELVRDLAQHFHVRIDMRQIGARDEAKELGGLAHCGEEFCCTRFGGEFQPVSIRMAKEQDLPLNPSKISGVCGRLMCCLRYEHEAYKDFKKRAPKKGTAVDTPLGEAIISGHNTPSETMELKLEDGKRFKVPLAEMDCHKGHDGCMRCSITNETVERCASRSMLIALGALTQQLEDVPASAASEETLDIKVGSTQSGRKRRRRSSGKSGEGASNDASTKRAAEPSAQKSEGGRKRRRRTTAPSNATHNQQGKGAAPKQQGSSDAAQKKASSGKVKKRRSHTSNKNAQKKTQAEVLGNEQKKSFENAPRKPQKEKGQGAKRNRAAAPEHRDKKPRPGRNSSGLRKPRRRHTADGSDS